ncbi:DegT/DnrJ/EryC1/StrS family aminotransferase [uncultured Thalassolituus sp.]|uniref:DegT/DnrJ/EryC1/StrS family aminotransferase n=1 Tax=uncultured Thalassolituus sp. TaxID=285273 RepID=UPI00260F3E13|nr:DegT/DnrJ/EryC1/StrS family aminotransferase [uncultured Thalassolituus sp.]
MKTADELRQVPLAEAGGTPVIDRVFPRYNSLGTEEAEAVQKVMETGVLSQFLGCWHEDFYGGSKVREFETQCQEYFGVKHAITVNSWTSGLIAAVGALDIEPGDEIIVSPWTMCASATAILQWNAIPVFADIDPHTFNLDPESVRANITEKTRAIMAVDIFGQSADMDALRQIADEFNLRIISDTAQAPAALYKGKFAGTLGDIGGYSLNYHKHVHTGEGGVVVTNDDALAERVRLIRNHAEAVLNDREEMPLNNMLGYNFRLGEIECAIGIEQLKKLPALVASRQHLAERLAEGIRDLPGLQVPVVGEGNTHVYYVFPLLVDPLITGCSKEELAAALKAEGVELATRYQNLHLLPMYQKKMAYGSTGFPWSAEFSRQSVSYDKGICPVAEVMNDSTYLGFGMCVYDLNEADIDLIIQAFRKVWAHKVAAV